MTDTQYSAVFYQQPVLVDRQRHRHWRLRPASHRFAAHTPWVPLTVGEFVAAAAEYPVVFGRNAAGECHALAVTGVAKGQNLFVDAQGVWQADHLPLSVALYPFVGVKNPGARLALGIDAVAAAEDAPGEALFDTEGAPAPLMARAMSALAKYQRQVDLTEAFVRRLFEAELLVRKNLDLRLPDGRSATLRQVWVVDEARLRAMPAERAAAWLKGGDLGLVFAHLLSLQSGLRLLKKMPRPAGAAAAAEATPAAAPAKAAKAAIAAKATKDTAPATAAPVAKAPKAKAPAQAGIAPKPKAADATGDAAPKPTAKPARARKPASEPTLTVADGTKPVARKKRAV